MNDTIKSLLGRRSIRNYTVQKVPKDLIELIVETGRYAASGKNTQSWYFSVITNENIIDDIVNANWEAQIKSAITKGESIDHIQPYHNYYHSPLVIFVSGDIECPFRFSDCAAATQNMAVAAHSLGLGSVYVKSTLPAFSGERNEELRKKLCIPDGYEPLYSIGIGYTENLTPPAPDRKENWVSYIE